MRRQIILLPMSSSNAKVFYILRLDGLPVLNFYYTMQANMKHIKIVVKIKYNIFVYLYVTLEYTTLLVV